MASGSYHGLDSEEDGGPYIIAFVPEAYEFVCSDAASQSESGKGQESSRLFHEESGVLQDQVRVTPAKPNIFSLYRYASSLDRVLTGIACLAAIAAGCGFPIPYKLAYKPPPCGPCETNALSQGGAYSKGGLISQIYGTVLSNHLSTNQTRQF
jgi:hypothetical protein